jgi:hypothetical protein
MRLRIVGIGFSLVFTVNAHRYSNAQCYDHKEGNCGPEFKMGRVSDEGPDGHYERQRPKEAEEYPLPPVRWVSVNLLLAHGLGYVRTTFWDMGR